MSKKVIAAILAVTAVLGAATIFFECQMTLRDKELFNLKNKMDSVQNELNIVQEKLKDANQIIDDLKDTDKLVYMGEFKYTHYCTEKFEHVCGEGAGLTYTGTKVTPGRSIAVDPKVIPLGSKVYVEGYGWRMAEDIGGGVDGDHIDIAVETHEQALSAGLTGGDVWLLVE